MVPIQRRSEKTPNIHKNQVDFKALKTRELTSAEKQAIIDNRSATDFFVPESQMGEYLQRRAVLDALAEQAEQETQYSAATTPSMMSYASYDPQEGLKSPQGYPLQRFKTQKAGYICDACDLAKPKGSVMFSAREESYDICNECVLKMAHGYGTPKDLLLQEEARKEQIRIEELALAREDGPGAGVAPGGGAGKIGLSPHEKMLANKKRAKEEQRVVSDRLRIT